MDLSTSPIVIIYGSARTGKTEFLTEQAIYLTGNKKARIENLHVLDGDCTIWFKKLTDLCQSNAYLFLDEFAGEESDWLVMLGTVQKHLQDVGQTFVATTQTPPDIIIRHSLTTVLHSQMNKDLVEISIPPKDCYLTHC